MQRQSQQNVSEASARMIDNEVRRMFVTATRSDRILTEMRADLETLAMGLLEFETLRGRGNHRPAQTAKKPNRESVLERRPAHLRRPPPGKQRPVPTPIPSGAAAAA